MNHNIPPQLLQEIIDGLTSGDIVIQHTEVEYLAYDDFSSRSGAMLRMPYGRRIRLELIGPPASPTPQQQATQQAAINMIQNAVAIAPFGTGGTIAPGGPPGPAATVKNLGVLKKYWVGYRDFKTDLKDGLLQSRNGHVWKSYEPLVAECTLKGVAHDPPVEKCECGIYAYDAPDHKELKAEGGIWGEVALYGDVYRCESGFRAELAYPLSLFMKDHGTKAVRRLKEHLEQTYGIPVFLVSERSGQTAADIITEAVASPDWPKSMSEIMETMLDPQGKIFNVFKKPFGL